MAQDMVEVGGVSPFLLRFGGGMTGSIGLTMRGKPSKKY